MDFKCYENAVAHMSEILYAERKMTCSFLVMTQEYIESFRFKELARDSRGNMLIPNDWYVVVTCQDGYKYHINVTCDSVLTMCDEVFHFISFK